MQLKIGTGRRVTITKEICDKMNFNEGDTLECEIDDNKLIVFKCQKSQSEKIKNEPKTEKHKQNDNEEELKEEIEEKEETEENKIHHSLKTTIEPVSIKDGFKKCTNCEELYNSGFILDEKFYCKACTIEDFKTFYQKYKGGKK